MSSGFVALLCELPVIFHLSCDLPFYVTWQRVKAFKCAGERWIKASLRPVAHRLKLLNQTSHHVSG